MCALVSFGSCDIVILLHGHEQDAILQSWCRVLCM